MREAGGYIMSELAKRPNLGAVVASSFADKFGCTLEVMENGEHYFQTAAQLAVYRSWLQKNLR